MKIRIRVLQNVQFYGDESKDNKNREDYSMASNSYLPDRGPLAIFIGEP